MKVKVVPFSRSHSTLPKQMKSFSLEVGDKKGRHYSLQTDPLALEQSVPCVGRGVRARTKDIMLLAPCVDNMKRFTKLPLWETIYKNTT